jgi:YggT family protein
MFVLGNFINALAGVLDAVLQIYMIIVVVAALITWVNPDPYNPIVRFLHNVTDPAFRLVRRILPLPPMGIDFSPLIVIFAIMFLRMFLVPTLQEFARTLS